MIDKFDTHASSFETRYCDPIFLGTAIHLFDWVLVSGEMVIICIRDRVCSKCCEIVWATRVNKLKRNWSVAVMNGRIRTLVTFVRVWSACAAGHGQEHDKWQIFPPRSFFTFSYFQVHMCIAQKPHHHQLHATRNHNAQTTKLSNNNRRPLLLSVFRLRAKNLLNYYLSIVL